ncbi:MAG: response regulator transcription factor [Nostocoides sp.]
MRVLLVEDEARMAAALVRGLGSEGFVTEHVTDGLAGLEAARFGGYDVVVLDIMLPRMSGYQIVRTLRAEGNWVPVLILSAKDGEYDEADGLDCGADDYLTKPFSFVVLVARLRALLRRDPVPRPVALTVGDLVVDPAAQRVTRGGADVSLSPTEFRLLEALARAHPTVRSKEHLLEAVWGFGEDVNVVEVYVGYLRRKLGRDQVVTVRGRGYRLAP